MSIKVSMVIIVVASILAAVSIFSIQRIQAVVNPKVSIQNGKLYVDGRPFVVRGVNYNPVPVGSDQLDSRAAFYDVPDIAKLHANTIGTYNAGKFEWAQWSNVDSGKRFYDSFYPVAEAHNLKIVVGYFSNYSMDWTDSARVAVVTSQYQELVLQAKDRPSTLMYLIGNEIFEYMPDEAQRIAYAQWIGRMVEWTDVADPDHPVTYADNATYTALPYLKKYAPTLDLYSINNYEWGTKEELTAILGKTVTLWSGKPIFLHEWGVDSWDVGAWSENEVAQANQLVKLYGAIDQVVLAQNSPIIGSLLFEYSDQFDKVGSNTTQDPDQGWPWACKNCFDGRANQDYWGIVKVRQSNQTGVSAYKKAYSALQNAWGTVSVTPTPTATSTPKATATPRKRKG